MLIKKTAASYPQDLAKVPMKGASLNNRFPMRMKPSFYGFIVREENSMPGFKGQADSLFRG